MRVETPLPHVKLPRLIGICGNPKSGKSEVQKILSRVFGYNPVDDGEVLRQFTIDYLGLSRDDVYTQEGKARFTDILGKSWQNRDILGTLGKQLEDMFGDQIMPFIAARKLHPHLLYSFGSVRKTQGQFYLDNGGVVVEVVNPDAPPSGFAFDRYDASLVTVSIQNDALSRGLPRAMALSDLEMKVIDAVNRVTEVAL